MDSATLSLTKNIMNIKNTYISFHSSLSKNRVLKRCVRIFTVLICIAFLAPFLANNKPLVVKYQGEWLFPAFSFKNQYTTSTNQLINYNMGNDWKQLDSELSLFPPCSYSPNTIDAENAPFVSPFDKQTMLLKNKQTISLPFKFRHWLGTTQNGNDVLSGILHGTKIALGIGVFSMLIASIIGILLGALAGYFENTNLKIGYIQWLFLILSLFISYFFWFIVRSDSLSKSFDDGGIKLVLRITLIIYLTYYVIKGFLKIGNKIDEWFHTQQKINFPIDSIISKVIEILNSIPSLLLIIALSAISKPSYSLLILIIGFLSWTNIARLTRAEYLKTKQLDYITSCKAIGMSHYSIMVNQILPNVFPIILVQIIFGMAGATLIEASLSFIGIGIPANNISWGSLLNEAQNNFSAWWLVVFPGLCVFLLLFIYNKIAEELSKSK